MTPVTPAAPVDVIVIGGGVAGLVAARECARIGLSVTVLEGTDALGGPVAGHELAGLHLDSGTESFAVRGGTVSAFIQDLGLTEAVVSPNPVGAWLHLPALDSRAGTAAVSVPLPKAGVLGIPGSPLADDVRAVIGWRGALRAYLDRMMPMVTIGRAHSLGDLVRKRMGDRVLQRLVEPVASGVYTASSVDLDVDIVAPGLNSALTKAGSLSGAVSLLRSGAPAGSAVGGLCGGMSRLVSTLHADLERHGVTVRTGAAVTELRRAPEAPTAAPTPAGAATPGWTVTVASPAASSAAGSPAVAPADGDDRERGGDEPATAALVLPARFVILATQGAQALRLLAPVSAELAELSALDWPQPTAVTLATLVLRTSVLEGHPRGTGVLVSADAPDVTAKALTHVTAKWPWVAQLAGPGREVLRLSFGRAGEPNPTDTLSDEQLQALALRDAGTLLGVHLSADMVLGFARTDWRDALSPATIGSRERAEQVRARVAATPGLGITGAWLAGTGLASVIPDAMSAAAQIRRAALDRSDKG
ncbi:MAG: FAD-dependent oxidoreductase [Cryobacterium sp.]